MKPFLKKKLLRWPLEQRSMSYRDQDVSRWPMCQIWYVNVNRCYRNGSDTKTCQNSINLILRLKVNERFISRAWMYAKHRLVVIYPYAKYVLPIWKQNKRPQALTATWVLVSETLHWLLVRRANICISPALSYNKQKRKAAFNLSIH